jgi:hypothetical protein
MDRVGSPRACKGLFARFFRAIAGTAERLKPTRDRTLYRPEKHYMRGIGPKSKRIATADCDGTPTAT